MWGERVRSEAAASAVGVIAAGRRGRSDRGAADRPALTVGGLPRLGGHDGSRPRRHVQLEPDLRPVALAPDRPRGVHGDREPGRPRLLEGRGPRHLQRLQLGRGRAAAADAAGAERRRPRPMDADPARLDRRHEDHRRDRRGRTPTSRRRSSPNGIARGHRRRDLAVGQSDGPGDELHGLGLLAAPLAATSWRRPGATTRRGRWPTTSRSSSRSERPSVGGAAVPSPSRCSTPTSGRRCRSPTRGAARHPRTPQNVGRHRPRSTSRPTRAPTRWPAGSPPRPARRTRS